MNHDWIPFSAALSTCRRNNAVIEQGFEFHIQATYVDIPLPIAAGKRWIAEKYWVGIFLGSKLAVTGDAVRLAPVPMCMCLPDWREMLVFFNRFVLWVGRTVGSVKRAGAKVTDSNG